MVSEDTEAVPKLRPNREEQLVVMVLETNGYPIYVIPTMTSTDTAPRWFTVMHLV